MTKFCAICQLANVDIINFELAAGYSIPSVSLKHFGDYVMLSELRRHKRSHMPRLELEGGSNGMGRNQITVVATGHKPGVTPRALKHPLFADAYVTEPSVIAVLPMRVKGVVYKAGASIPESVWNPKYLAAALRAGTVRKKAS